MSVFAESTIEHEGYRADWFSVKFGQQAPYKVIRAIQNRVQLEGNDIESIRNAELYAYHLMHMERNSLNAHALIHMTRKIVRTSAVSDPLSACADRRDQVQITTSARMPITPQDVWDYFNSQSPLGQTDVCERPKLGDSIEFQAEAIEYL